MNWHKLLPLVLFACGGEPIYDNNMMPATGLTTPTRITDFLDGKTLIMEGVMIPTHPNGYDQNVDFGAATQCYMKVTMTPLGGKIRVMSQLGTLANGACDRGRL